MFDLEHKISEWKLMFAASSSITNENAVELELHLRESVEDLVAKGLPESEAFMIASLRVGNPDKLSQEFCKVNGNHVWKGRVTWMLLGFVGGNALTNAFNGISTIIGATTTIVGFNGTFAGLSSIAVLVICWTILFWLLWQSRPIAQSIAGSPGVSIGWMVSLVTLWISGYGLSFVGRVAQATNVSVEEFGRSAYWTSIGSIGISVCVVATCVAMIAADSRSQVEKSERVA